MRDEGNLKITALGDLEIVMTRTLDAPRTLVFDAFTKPELVSQEWKREWLQATTAELLARGWEKGARQA